MANTTIVIAIKVSMVVRNDGLVSIDRMYCVLRSPGNDVEGGLTVETAVELDELNVLG